MTPEWEELLDASIREATRQIAEGCKFAYACPKCQFRFLAEREQPHCGQCGYLFIGDEALDVGSMRQHIEELLEHAFARLRAQAPSDGEMLFQARRLLAAWDAKVRLSKGRGGMGADLLSMDAALLTSIHCWEGLRRAIERAQAPEPQEHRTLCPTCWREIQPEAQQPAAKPKAGHAFVPCPSPTPCEWCHHPDCDDTPRSEHPEGR